MGYIRGLLHGTVVGTVVGLCVAPQDGRTTREQIQGVAGTVRDGAQQVVDTARRAAPAAQTAARQVGEAVVKVTGRRHQEEVEDGALISVNGSASPGS